AGLVRAGKVREIGCSNFTAELLRTADTTSRARGIARFVSVQNEYSMLHREPEQEVLDECQRLGIAFLPYFPLANGLLTGKYRLGKPVPEKSRLSSGARATLTLNDRNLKTVERLIGFAEEHGHTLLELAISWLLAHTPVASVIAGATRASQARGNAASAEWKLSAEELAAVNQLLSGAEAPPTA
ncbi:MAG: aldo/keto reductase, partial [Gemmatimonadota bacterium]